MTNYYINLHIFVANLCTFGEHFFSTWNTIVWQISALSTNMRQTVAKKICGQIFSANILFSRKCGQGRKLPVSWKCQIGLETSRKHNNAKNIETTHSKLCNTLISWCILRCIATQSKYAFIHEPFVLNSFLFSLSLCVSLSLLTCAKRLSTS